MKKTLKTSGLTLLGLSIYLFTGLANAAIPSELKLDYAYYALTSLVVKEQKLLEKAFTENQD